MPAFRADGVGSGSVTVGDGGGVIGGDGSGPVVVITNVSMVTDFSSTGRDARRRGKIYNFYSDFSEYEKHLCQPVKTFMLKNFHPRGCKFIGPMLELRVKLKRSFMQNNDALKRFVNESDKHLSPGGIKFARVEFNQWNNVKINLELHGRQPKISQSQLWWTGVGRNIGTEINGKNERFSRPVLIYRKLCSNKFMAIPLTSKLHEGSWYIPFMHNGKKQIAVIGDAKTMSTKRLYRMIGKIDDADYERIRGGFVKLYG